MQKFFVNNNQIKDDIVTIIDTDVNHIVNALRLKKDDEIQICNQDTSENFIARIDSYDNNKVNCIIINKIESNVEIGFDLDIYQGLPKADKMELIIQKTTEIGITSIIPVAMERCVVKLNEKDALKKTQRWQKIAEVAAKQSKRDIIPLVENPIKFSELKDRIDDYDLFIVAYEEEQKLTLKDVLKDFSNNKLNDKSNKYRVGVLVGPEGGIDIKEIEFLKRTSTKIVTLGKRILRTETAPIVIAGDIIYELE